MAIYALSDPLPAGSGLTAAPDRRDAPEAHKAGWLDGVMDVLNGLEGVRPVLGHGTGYDGPVPDELCGWIAEVRDQVAALREDLA